MASLGVAIEARQKVYPVDVALVFSVSGRGLVSAEKPLGAAAWPQTAAEGPLRRHADQVADGPPRRIGDMGRRRLPVEVGRLIGEPRMETANMTPQTSLPTPRSSAWPARSRRWICEQRISS